MLSLYIFFLACYAMRLYRVGRFHCRGFFGEGFSGCKVFMGNTLAVKQEEDFL